MGERLDLPGGIQVARMAGRLMIGIVAASLGSCSTSSSVSPAKVAATSTKASPAATDPLLRLVATMPIRTSQGFREPATGEMLKIEVVRAYDAASGRLCREYVVTYPQGGARQGLACRTGEGWQSARPLRLETAAQGAAGIR